MITGKYLTATIGNATIAGVQQWRASESVDKLDGQTGEHLGYSANEGGSRTLTITMRLVQDIATGEYSAVSAGTTITNLKLYRDVGATSLAANVPTATVFESDQGAEVKGRFEVNVTCEAYGAYTMSDPS